MINIEEPKPNQLYKVEWNIKELDVEGYGVGYYSLFEENGETYLDFKVDGEKMIYRFELYHIVSIEEYNYDRKSKL